MLVCAIILTLFATIVDLKRREIPDGIPLALIVAGAAASCLRLDDVPLAHRVIGCTAGFLLGALLFKVGAFGGGDAKLAAGLGAALGLPVLVPVLLFTAIAGGLIAIVGKRRGMLEIPYGPAFLVGLLVFVAVRYGESIHV